MLSFYEQSETAIKNKDKKFFKDNSEKFQSLLSAEEKNLLAKKAISNDFNIALLHLNEAGVDFSKLMIEGDTALDFAVKNKNSTREKKDTILTLMALGALWGHIHKQELSEAAVHNPYDNTEIYYKIPQDHYKFEDSQYGRNRENIQKMLFNESNINTAQESIFDLSKYAIEQNLPNTVTKILSFNVPSQIFIYPNNVIKPNTPQHVESEGRPTAAAAFGMRSVNNDSGASALRQRQLADTMTPGMMGGSQPQRQQHTDTIFNRYQTPEEIKEEKERNSQQMAEIECDMKEAKRINKPVIHINYQEYSTNLTLLHIAASCCNWPICDRLIKANADPMLKTVEGETPFMLAVRVASSNKNLEPVLTNLGAITNEKRPQIAQLPTFHSVKQQLDKIAFTSIKVICNSKKDNYLEFKKKLDQLDPEKFGELQKMFGEEKKPALQEKFNNYFKKYNEEKSQQLSELSSGLAEMKI